MSIFFRPPFSQRIKTSKHFKTFSTHINSGGHQLLYSSFHSHIIFSAHVFIKLHFTQLKYFHLTTPHHTSPPPTPQHHFVYKTLWKSSRTTTFINSHSTRTAPICVHLSTHIKTTFAPQNNIYSGCWWVIMGYISVQNTTNRHL